MGRGAQKPKKYEAVRIWEEPKNRLVELVLKKSLKGKGRVTEVSEASKAIEQYCDREEPKLKTA